MPADLPMTPSMRAIAAMPELDIRKARVRQAGGAWRATVRVGRTDDIAPIWSDAAATADAAVERAAGHALGFWQWRLRPQARGSWRTAAPPPISNYGKIP